jgi:hypothetical protein
MRPGFAVPTSGGSSVPSSWPSTVWDVAGLESPYASSDRTQSLAFATGLSPSLVHVLSVPNV